MNFLGIWIAVAAIAVATQVAADANLRLACHYAAKAVLTAKLSPEDPETYEFAKRQISKSSDLRDETRRQALKDAWDEVYYGRDCSEKSWDYMAEVAECLKNDFKLEFLISPLEKYVKKCFNFNDLDQRIKSAAESSKVDFIDSKFFERYHKDNPNALKKDETKWYVDASCCYYNSAGALTDAIERNLVEEGKDPKKFFVKPKDVSGYLKEKLFQPCDNLIQSFDPVYLTTIRIKDYDVDGNIRDYESLLSQEANEALFRYKYCDESKLSRVEIVKKMLKKFLPELEPTNDDKSMILEDCLVPGYSTRIIRWQ